jgi:orotate phosphoribosyltransferase
MAIRTTDADRRQATASQPLVRLAEARRGHFRLESGHHTDGWLDLDVLFAQPQRLRPYIVELAGRLRRYAPQIVCGPLIGGAFLAAMTAQELGVSFCFAERSASQRAGRYSVSYRIPAGLRPSLRERSVALVDDAISAGSAVRATLEDLDACGATVVVIDALILVGDRAQAFAADRQLALEWLEQVENRLWDPRDCPLCAAGEPLDQR